MIFDKIKNFILTNILFKAFIFILLIVSMIFYFKSFFTVGINFDETFLKKEVISSESHYIGNNSYGDIHITVKGIISIDGNAEVIYRLPNNIIKQFKLNADTQWKSNILYIKDNNGTAIFEGYYQKDSFFLYDKNRNPLLDNSIQFIIIGQSPYNSDYNISLKNVADMAYFSNDTIRGRYEYLVFAILLFIITAIDIKFPLFFFTLSHFLDVRNPEPSDFYIVIQKITWYAYPILGIILMVVAIY